MLFLKKKFNIIETQNMANNDKNYIIEEINFIEKKKNLREDGLSKFMIH